jgi:predicted unusual protein kinase regulating ubiquinone biosynthesis (AarF/ABC1/UbiB family)
MGEFLRLLFYILFCSELSCYDIFRILNIVAFSFIYKNTEENRQKLSEKLSDLGLVVIKLSQWLSYFIEVKYEDYENLQLLIQSLPLLQCKCKKKKNTRLSYYLSKFPNTVKSYETDMLAAASIGQIYKGKDYDNNDIVIKIKNMDIEKDIDKWEKFLKKLFLVLNLQIDLNSFFQALRNQLDFEKEANNMKLFYKKYKKNELVKIPKYIAGDKNIIIMEYVPSVNFREYREQCTEEELEYYLMLSRILYQDTIFIQDIVHLDLHNGNYGLQPQTKSIVLYDFGWVLENQHDFKKFFILCHINCKKPLEFFLQKYNLDYNTKLSLYVKDAIEKKHIDVLEGLKVIIKLFPNNICLDDFMFCVLSVCIFISSLMDELQTDLDSQIKEELKFIEENVDKNAFLSLGAVFKYSIENSDQGFLSKWYQEM